MSDYVRLYVKRELFWVNLIEFDEFFIVREFFLVGDKGGR